MKDELINHHLVNITRFEQSFLQLPGYLVKQDDEDHGYLYPLLMASCKRSASLATSFVLLARANQYMVAAALIRMQLDNALRFYAGLIVKDKEAFHSHFLLGTQSIGDMKDIDGNLMKDWYLKKKLNSMLPGITKIYDETSGYVHLSSAHFNKHVKFSEKTDTSFEIEFSMSGDDEISNNLKFELVEKMYSVCGIVIGVIRLVDTFRKLRNNKS